MLLSPVLIPLHYLTPRPSSTQGPKFTGEVKGLSGPGTIGMGYLGGSDKLVLASEDGSLKVRLKAAVTDLGLPNPNRPTTHLPTPQPPSRQISPQGINPAEGESTTLTVPGPLSCMAVHAPADSEGDGASPLVALGGKERDLSLWDVTTGTSTWLARNVPHDKLDLREPVWVTAVRFQASSPHVLAAGTGYKQLRIYDARAQRRPVRTMDLEGYRVTAITGEPSGKGKASLAGTQGNGWEAALVT